MYFSKWFGFSAKRPFFVTWWALFERSFPNFQKACFLAFLKGIEPGMLSKMLKKMHFSKFFGFSAKRPFFATL
jgi:hypothetical protein